MAREIVILAYNKKIAVEVEAKVKSATKAPYTPTPQAQTVLDWVANGSGHAIVEAGAGCGKTSLLLAAVALMDGDIRVQTVHAAGFSAVRYAFKAVKVDENKVRGIIDGIARREAADPDGHYARAGAAYDAGDELGTVRHLNNFRDPIDVRDTPVRMYNGALGKLVSLAKQAAIGFLAQINDLSAWYAIVEHFGLEDELEGTCSVEQLVAYAQQVLRTSISMDREVIDFDDMVLAPLVHNLRVWPKDWVLVDEAQDTNAARRALAFKMMRPKTGRSLWVGDRTQAIYGFTGADSNALGIIQSQLGAATFPLTVTFRCPKAVVRLANQWMPALEAHPSAPEGVVSTITNDDFLAMVAGKKLTAADVVLCRNNAPLGKMAFKFIRQGVACVVEGRDIGKGLVKLAQKWKVSDLAKLEDRLAKWLDDQSQKLVAKGQDKAVDALADKVETLKVIIDKCRAEGKYKVADLVETIETMFADTEGKSNVLVLSSGHKSKGREWRRVFWYGRNAFQPSPYARKDWEVESEDFLCGVMATRSMGELHEIIAPVKQKEVGA